VNWRNAPAYKLPRLFTLKVKQIASLPHSFDVRNTTELICELQQTLLTPTSNFASLDITNLYSNIPMTQTKQFLNNMLASNLTDSQTRSELLNLYEVITKQNYFQHNDKTVIQTDGLAIGAPSSSVRAEIFLQHVEHTHLPNLTQKHKLVNYFRYVDDILLTYDSLHTDIHTILQDSNLQFTQEVEQDSAI
jgi:hypothetical protein